MSEIMQILMKSDEKQIHYGNLLQFVTRLDRAEWQPHYKSPRSRGEDHFQTWFITECGCAASQMSLPLRPEAPRLSEIKQSVLKIVQNMSGIIIGLSP